MLTKAECARRKDVSPPAVTQAIRHGQLIPEDDGSIDETHPVNAAWLAKPARQHPKRTARKERERLEKEKSAAKVDDAPTPGPPKNYPKSPGRPRKKPIDENPVKKPMGRPPKHKMPSTSDYDAKNFDPGQKLYEETRWKKAQADMKSLEYAEKLGVMNDNTALDRKFGTFQDFLLNDLIYMPEESSDILWAEASTSENPVKTLEDGLKKRIAKIIESAQAAAREVLPPKTGTSYIFIEDNE
jgi:hypothetical protein